MPLIRHSIGGLPSEEHAVALLERPSPGNVALVAADVCLRSALVGMGLAVARVGSRLVPGALMGSLAIELFVLAFVAANKRPRGGA